MLPGVSYLDSVPHVIAFVVFRNETTRLTGPPCYEFILMSSANNGTKVTCDHFWKRGAIFHNSMLCYSFIISYPV